MSPLAIALSVLAGFVDAIGYLSLGGFYVAFMSGNSTLLSVELAEGQGRTGLAAGLVLAFVLGVTLGTLAGQRMGGKMRTGVLVLVAALLAGAAGLHALGFPAAAGLAMALAMGTENTVLQRPGQAAVGVTYMTGTLVRLGQRLAETATHGNVRPLLPDLLLWGGMLAGAVTGALAFGAVGVTALWGAVAGALTLACLTWPRH